MSEALVGLVVAWVRGPLMGETAQGTKGLRRLAGAEFSVWVSLTPQAHKGAAIQAYRQTGILMGGLQWDRAKGLTPGWL